MCEDTAKKELLRAVPFFIYGNNNSKVRNQVGLISLYENKWFYYG